MKKEKNKFRIWSEGYVDGLYIANPTDICVPTYDEAAKITKYLNSKIENKNHGYCSKLEKTTIYKTAEEFIAEKEKTSKEKETSRTIDLETYREI